MDWSTYSICEQWKNIQKVKIISLLISSVTTAWDSYLEREILWYENHGSAPTKSQKSSGQNVHTKKNPIKVSDISANASLATWGLNEKQGVTCTFHMIYYRQDILLLHFFLFTFWVVKVPQTKLSYRTGSSSGGGEVNSSWVQAISKKVRFLFLLPCV